MKTEKTTATNSSGGEVKDVKAKEQIITNKTTPQLRRGKRDKEGGYTLAVSTKAPKKKKKKKKTSKALQKHGKDNPSGGLESLIPSLIGVVVLVVAVMAQRGFRGRASVAGIDLGTTNSVICVQRPSKGVGVIDCIPDPSSGSPIIVGFLLFSLGT